MSNWNTDGSLTITSGQCTTTSNGIAIVKDGNQLCTEDQQASCTWDWSSLDYLSDARVYLMILRTDTTPSSSWPLTSNDQYVGAVQRHKPSMGDNLWKAIYKTVSGSASSLTSATDADGGSGTQTFTASGGNLTFTSAGDSINYSDGSPLTAGRYHGFWLLESEATNAIDDYSAEDI